MEQIQYLMGHYDLSATNLADKLGIQRSTISHLMSGRNNPSIDLLRRIISNFPDINEAWLLSGHGSPLKSTQTTSKQSGTSNYDQVSLDTFVNRPNDSLEDTFVTSKTQSVTEGNKDVSEFSAVPSVNNQDIEQILVFYTDGTFKYFRPRE